MAERASWRELRRQREACHDRDHACRDRRARDRIGRRRHVCGDRGGAIGCRSAAGGPQPDRRRRRHRDGADDGRSGARFADAGSLDLSFARYAPGGPRAVRREPVAAAVRGRARLHPPDGCMGRRLGPQRRPYRRRPGARPRCVYVDFLNTGPAVSKTLRAIVNKTSGIRKAGDLLVTDLVSHAEEVVGAAALHLASGAPVTIAAKATIIATGGLTRLYRRNSASANMSGDGYALALRASAPLVDMEFVQFFPIGHLAPRLIGMDPIMWDPFRYKLGGRLLNGSGQEFTSRYGSSEDGAYVLTRDLATYAIIKEVEAGRGSPHGGAYLSFEHCPPAELRAAFGPVIDRLAMNAIDITKMQ